MSKHFKHDTSIVSQQVEPDAIVLIKEMQQHLVFLEKKIDTLISQSSEKPFKGRHFSKPSRPFSHSRYQGKGNYDNSSRDRNFVQAICADCKKECEVPFKPSPDRPVYCRECFSKRKDGGPLRERHFDRQRGNKNRGFGQRKKPFYSRRKEPV